MRIAWAARECPLEAIAAFGSGRCATALAARASANGCDVFRFGEDIVVTGDDLPWADGVEYLGEHEDAPLALVPVHRSPALPGGLVERIVRSLVGPGPHQVALIPDEHGTRVRLLVLEAAR